jgi:hypothetical protein
MSEPKMGDIRIHVTTLAYGQRRPYADHVYTYRILIESVPFSTRDNVGFEPVEWHEDIVRPILRGIRNWTRDSRQGEDWSNFHQTYLRSLNKVGPGTWEWTVVEPYLD